MQENHGDKFPQTLQQLSASAIICLFPYRDRACCPRPLSKCKRLKSRFRRNTVALKMSGNKPNKRCSQKRCQKIMWNIFSALKWSRQYKWFNQSREPVWILAMNAENLGNCDITTKCSIETPVWALLLMGFYHEHRDEWRPSTENKLQTAQQQHHCTVWKSHQIKKGCRQQHMIIQSDPMNFSALECKNLSA